MITLLVLLSQHVEYAFPWMLIPALVSVAAGISQSSKANKKINELESQPFPNYSLSPELSSAYQRSVKMAQQGYTGAEKAAFQNQTAQAINTQSQRALDLGGGNLSRTISRMGSIANLDAQNKFAANDAMLKRQNIKYSDVLAQALQQQQNLKSQADITHRVMLEQAYGTAGKVGSENIMRGIGMGALALGGGYGAGAGGNTSSTLPYDASFRMSPRLNTGVPEANNTIDLVETGPDSYSFGNYGQLAPSIPRESYSGQ